jgi:hypothetical protein
MRNSDITDRADSMKSGCAVERREMPQDLRQGCLECAADVLSKVLDLSSPVPVPEELVQAAIRVFPIPPPPVKPSSAPALPLLAPRLTYSLQDAQLEPLQVDRDVPQPADSAEAVVTVGTSSKR